VSGEQGEPFAQQSTRNIEAVTQCSSIPSRKHPEFVENSRRIAEVSMNVANEAAQTINCSTGSSQR
jgi:hypothetical protein